MAGPLIVTAEFAPEDFAWLDALRRRHYPAERNQVLAHLTLFHAIAPSAEDELRQILKSMAGRQPPRACISSIMNLGGGVALRVASERLRGLLTAQDSAGWSAHVTIQNKAPPGEARALIDALGDQFLRRPIHISGIGLHRYLGGPWETLRTFSFRG